MKKFLVLVMALCMVFTLGIAQAEEAGAHDTTKIGHVEDCKGKAGEVEWEEIYCEKCFIADTCEVKGQKAWHCSVCGKIVRVEEVDVNKEHVYVDHKQVDATCLEKGTTAYSVCENKIEAFNGKTAICGLYKVVDGKTLAPQDIPAKGHSTPVPEQGWDPMAVPCGKIYENVIGVCKDCGIKLVDEITIKVDHEMDKDVEAKEPTCYSIGWNAHKECKHCGVKKGYVEAKIIDHNWKFVEGTAGSCTENAWKDHYQCTMCGQRALIEKVNGKDTYVIYPDNSDKLGRPYPGHKEEKIAAVPATCLTKGATEGKKCSVCGEVTVKPTETPALGHAWEMVPGKKATCEEPGVVAHSVCTRKGCGAIDGENTVIPAHGHVDQDGYWPEEPTEERKANVKELVVSEKEMELTGGLGVAPTCETDGYKPALYCPWCEEERVAKTIVPATGHDWKIIEEGFMPGCVNPGKADLWECQNKGCIDKETNKQTTKGGHVVNALGHALKTIPYKAPTCLEDGNFAWAYCTRDFCDINKDETLFHAEFIYAGEDDFFTQGWPTPDEGLTQVQIIKGGLTYPEAVIIPAMNHGYAYGWEDDYVTPVAPVAPTCTETGRADDGLYCELCETVFKTATVLPANGHTYSDVIAAVEPTCTETGNVAFKYCTVKGCNHAETVVKKGETPVFFTIKKTKNNNWNKKIPAAAVVAALGHDVKTGVAKAATCLTAGTTAGEYCGRCGLTLKEETTVKALGHNMVKVKDGWAATCIEPGMTDKMQCTRENCDLLKIVDGKKVPYTEVKVIDPLGHLYTDAGYVAPVAATCTEPGWTEGLRCARCLPDYAESEGWVKKPQATALAPHTLKYKENQNIGDSCETVGYYDWNECTKCDWTTGKMEDVVKHNWISFEDKAPTCTEYGVNGASTCTNCGQNRPQTAVEPLGHEYVSYYGPDGKGKAPTCTEAGYTEGKWCVRCTTESIKVKSEAKAALGHDMKHVDAKAATCTTPGNEVGMACSRCDHKTGCEEIKALGHKGVWSVEIEPTYDEYGLEVEICSECGAKLDAKLIDKLTTGLIGDVNLDGRVSLADVLEILKVLLGESTNYSKVNADMNKDGNITLSDAFALLAIL